MSIILRAAVALALVTAFLGFMVPVGVALLFLAADDFLFEFAEALSKAWRRALGC